MNLFLIISSFDVELTRVATAVTFYDGKRSVRPPIRVRPFAQLGSVRSSICFAHGYVRPRSRLPTKYIVY